MIEYQGRGVLHEHGVFWCAFIDKRVGHEGYKGSLIVSSSRRRSRKMSLSQYLESVRLQEDEVHTHTWFSGGFREKATMKLSVADKRILQEKLLQHVLSAKTLETGPNSITEKVQKDGKFPMFSDTDLHCEDVEGVPFEELIELLKAIPEMLTSVIEEVTGKRQRMVLLTRLPYKLHIHFPDVIVNRDGALMIIDRFTERFKGHRLYAETAVDMSVYRTGLRLPWCHKGSMGKEEKKEAERVRHEEAFGAGTWTGFYEITDPVTWEKKKKRTLEDLVLTSIIAPGDAELTPLLDTRGELVPPKGKPEARKRKIEEVEGTIVTNGARMVESGSEEEVGVSANLKEFLKGKFELRGEVGTGRRRGESVIIPTNNKACPYAKREHQGNHLYVVLSKGGAELRCHNSNCKQGKKKLVSMEQMPGALRSEAEGLTGAGLDEEGLEKIRNSVREAAEFWPGLDASELSTPVRSSLDSSLGYLTHLTRNRYCPLCQREHDSALNCMLTTPEWQRLICRVDMDTQQFPTPSEHTTIFATIKNLNVNVTVKGQDDNTLRDFGRVEDFPQVHEDSELNRLCFESLSGRTKAVAKYMLKLMEGKYAFQNEEWYWFEGRMWRRGVPPDDLMDEDMTRTYYNVMEYYGNEKQQGWIRQMITEMGSLAKRKIYIEDLERTCRQEGAELPFDENVYLLGFENGVFNSRDGSFRQHRAEDYLTKLLPYDLPTKIDEGIRGDIDRLIMDIMPDEEIREFLITTLALNLEGLNRHNIAMVWTGSGGNGKGVMKLLMHRAFGHFHSEPPATFLTSERPSADKPSADLVSLEHTRSVFCSEPQDGKKANSGFVKFITGNDVVTARNVHEKKNRTFRPRFLVTLLCNTIPLFQGAETEVRGLWRRLKIIRFEMEFVENPQHWYERKLDHQLEERTETWGPQFMLLLIEKYREYIARGRKITVPKKVEHNLQEQKEENDPFPNWFRQNVEARPGNKLHVHLLMERFNAEQTADKRYQTRNLTTKLRGMKVRFGDKQLRGGCECGKNNTYIDGYDWKGDEEDSQEE